MNHIEIGEIKEENKEDFEDNVNYKDDNDLNDNFKEFNFYEDKKR